ncbi:MAG: hypothetical protein ACTHN0_05110 [Aquihabitans sp.]
MSRRRLAVTGPGSRRLMDLHTPTTARPARRLRRRRVIAGTAAGLALATVLVTGCASEGDDPTTSTSTSTATTSSTIATSTTAANTSTSTPQVGSEPTIAPGNSQNTPDEGPGGGDEPDEQNRNENYPYGPTDSDTDGNSGNGPSSGTG